MKPTDCELPPPYDLSGSTPPNTAPLRRVRRRLREIYPEDVAQADAEFFSYWHEDYPINGNWLVRFAETTAAAMRRRDTSRVDGHLSFFSSLLSRCGPYLQNLIDVNYMEDLFYNVDVRSARWGWRRVPPNLQKLYVECWSQVIPSFVERLQPPKSRQTKP